MKVIKLLRKKFISHSYKYQVFATEINPNLKLGKIYSQHGHEYIISLLLGNKKGGYFVEFGVIDGITNSNTYYLEERMGWNGIVAEPAKKWHKNLMKNRRVHIETDCVFSESNLDLEFIETGKWKGGNTLMKHLNSDNKKRTISSKYLVKTISLNDLLDKYNAPRHVEFISIDTEGSELEIIKNFKFTKYSFSIICVEHNGNIEKRESLQKIFEENNYFKLPLPDSLTNVDDWYVNEDIFNSYRLITLNH